MVELLVALLLFTAIMTAALSFFQKQGRAFTHGNERTTVLQSLRYAMGSMEQHIHTLGVGTVTAQPGLVYADSTAIAFNANYASRVQDDPFAVFYDPYLPEAAVSAVDDTRMFQLPHSTFSYPDTTYWITGTNSPAETIIFYFEPDTDTDRTDDYVLYRQLNDQSAEIITRNILKTPGDPFFEFWGIDPDDADSTLIAAPANLIPAAHTVTTHGAAGDTLPYSYVDLVRGVRVSFTATNGLTDGREQTREISRLIRFPNIDAEELRTCGNSPLLGASFNATAKVDAQGAPYAELDWNRAIDEAGGELDIVRYVLWKKTSSGADWDDPFLSIPPGELTYQYPDTDVVEGQSYWYALAAQDCTPQYSTIESASVVIPVP